MTPGIWLRRVADWCVPDSALRWGRLTAEPTYGWAVDRRGRIYAWGTIAESVTDVSRLLRPWGPTPHPEEFDAAPRDLIRHIAPPRGFGERDA